MLGFSEFLNESSSDAKKRFMSKVKKTKGGCWVMSAHKSPYGYHQIWHNGMSRQAHKLSYELFKGKIPAGKVVRHKCDNRRCVRPSHLILGSSADNNRDISKSGHVRNQYTGPLKGSPRDLGTQPSKSKQN